MSLAQLHIHNLRNIKFTKLDLHPKLNFFFGANGSGKTSLLEAIYLLGTGHSFRTREILPLISYKENCLNVFARTTDAQTISMQKSISSATQVRLNSVPCYTSSELARFLPCQVFYQDIFQIIDAGPAARRHVIDWGLFHVKHDYHILWKNYRRALKQRNSLLRQKAAPKEFSSWNLTLSELGNHLNDEREAYFLRFLPEFQRLLPNLTNLNCGLLYYKGWDKRNLGKSLKEILDETMQADLLRQYTQLGAHQADIFIDCEERHAKHYLSRGQQKIILFALKLAQAKITPKPCLYLCDDLTSEFDQEHIERLIKLIISTEGQFFITAANHALLQPLLPSDAKIFFLTEGIISDAISLS